MKILVTGCKGQLGTQILNVLNNEKSELGDIPVKLKNAEIVGIDVQELDITNLEKTIDYILNVKPDVIINPAAFTNVDACESNEDIAFKVNALGARNIAIAGEKVGAKIIHISTDYVFSGQGTTPIKEYDITGPVSVYGKTKLAGEDYVRQFASKYFIIRTAWLYGYHGNNFVKTIIKAGKEKGHLTVVNDQRGNPTNAEDLVHHLLKISVTEDYGIYHCTGNGECSWFDFASAIIEYSGITCTIEPVTSEQFARAAKRPSYSSLDNMMLRCTVKDEMREWREALGTFIEKFKEMGGI